MAVLPTRDCSCRDGLVGGIEVTRGVASARHDHFTFPLGGCGWNGMGRIVR